MTLPILTSPPPASCSAASCKTPDFPPWKGWATFQPWRAKPVRRVYIPKKSDSSKRRPLGIPTIMDRCLQAMVKNALEPAWESRFEGSSYGFRPGRNAHDAIEKIYGFSCPNRRKKVVVDADIAGAFDNISQEFILKALGDVPGKALIKQWLKAVIWRMGGIRTPRAEHRKGA